MTSSGQALVEVTGVDKSFGTTRALTEPPFDRDQLIVATEGIAQEAAE